MAYTTKVKSTLVGIAMGNGATPTELFAPLCGINTKGFTQTRQTSDTTDWDCADPDALPIVVRDLGPADWSITGSGLLHAPLLATLQEAFEASDPVNFRFTFDDSTIDGYYQGPGIVTSLEINGTNGEYVQISITITAAGPLTFTDNP